MQPGDAAEMQEEMPEFRPYLLKKKPTQWRTSFDHGPQGAGRPHDGARCHWSVTGPVASDLLHQQVTNINTLPPDQQWRAMMDPQDMTGQPLGRVFLASQNYSTYQATIRAAADTINDPNQTFNTAKQQKRWRKPMVLHRAR